jgi:anti-anti-sigma factor
MSVEQRAAGSRLVLSPHEALLAGGPAEEFERRVQALLRGGYRHLVVDLSRVPSIDSAGIRALVRGHTTAQRMESAFALAAINPRVRATLELSRLDSVFTIHDSLASAQARRVPWGALRIAAAIAVLTAGLWWADRRLAPEPAPGATLTETGTVASTLASPIREHPLLELLKLVVAAFVGLVVTTVQRRLHREKPLSQAMEHAQILLCVSGAAIMMIIGNSLARAFGIAGAASIIRFRTPVEDPKDITILFLLMALGMASGLGLFAVTGLGAAFLCGLLAALDYVGSLKPRTMMVEIVSEGREFPVGHVQGVFARNKVVFEPREMSQGDEATIEYHTTLDPRLALEDLSAQLMAEGSGVQSVSWKPPKRD